MNDTAPVDEHHPPTEGEIAIRMIIGNGSALSWHGTV